MIFGGFFRVVRELGFIFFMCKCLVLVWISGMF